MKALVLKGSKEKLSYLDFKDPFQEKESGIVLIKAAAFNRRDYWVTQGKYPGIKYPVIPGSDGAGMFNDSEVVIQPGLNWGKSEAFQSKEYQILGMPSNGTFAEKVQVPLENIFPKPSHLNWEQAAALPLGGLTAYRAVFTKCQIKPTDTVLISGVGGGVASICLLFCVAIGAKTYVTSGSPDKIEKAISLGASGGFNYKKDGWVKELKTAAAGGVDVIIDSAAGASFNKLISCAMPGARIALYGGTQGAFSELGPWPIFWKQLHIMGTTMGSPSEFKEMLSFVGEHKIVPSISTVFPLEQGQEGMEMLENHEQFGKIVLKI